MVDSADWSLGASSAVAHAARTFELQRHPANVRFSRWLDQMRIARFVRQYHEKICQWALGTRLVSHEGRFAYRRGRDVREVAFNGGNLQFHALYDALYRHGYELETAVLLTQLCRGEGAFFDIGSNWGYFSLLLAAAPGFTGPVYAFEPNPRSFADLLSVIDQAGVADRVQACNFGLGREPSELSVTETDAHSTGMARLTRGGAGPRIAVKRLDDLEIPAPNLIKIDAEGMEAEILAGGRRLLETARPFVVFESLMSESLRENIQAPFEVLRTSGYRFFLPSLIFESGGQPVWTTYNCHVELLYEGDSSPKLGLFEFAPGKRSLFRPQVNVLAVPDERIAGLWLAGMVNSHEEPNLPRRAGDGLPTPGPRSESPC